MTKIWYEKYLPDKNIDNKIALKNNNRHYKSIKLIIANLCKKEYYQNEARQHVSTTIVDKQKRYWVFILEINIINITILKCHGRPQGYYYSQRCDHFLKKLLAPRQTPRLLLSVNV